MPADLTTWLLVFLRVSALLAVFPVFSGGNFPRPIRLALGLLLAGFITPALPPALPADASLWALIGLMGLEVGVGLVLGLIARLVFLALDLAGAIVSAEIGLTLPPGLNPLSESQETLPAMILHFLAIALWLTLDLHHWMLRCIGKSYAVLPIGAATVSEAVAVDLLRRTGEIFLIAVQMAAPLMAVSFVITLVFSVLGRAVPQMNVFFESFTVRVMAGLALFGATCQFMAQHIINYLRRLPEDVLRVAQLLGGA